MNTSDMIQSEIFKNKAKIFKNVAKVNWIWLCRLLDHFFPHEHVFKLHKDIRDVLKSPAKLRREGNSKFAAELLSWAGKQSINNGI